MDVEEFMNQLFDKIETALKGHPEQMFLKAILGGQISQQIISKVVNSWHFMKLSCYIQDCEHISARVDDFFALPCIVKDKGNVAESLRTFIKPDVLDGDNMYQCDGCNAKVTAVKRTCIRSLPDTLILHLKRIDFDFELLERAKINDRYEFPEELDMYDFMLEAQDDGKNQPPEPRTRDYYKFRLAGVLIHRCVSTSHPYHSSTHLPSQRHGGVRPLLLVCAAARRHVAVDQLQRRHSAGL